MTKKQFSHCLGLWAKGGKAYNSEAGGVFGVMEIVSVLIVAISPVCPSVKIYKSGPDQCGSVGWALSHNAEGSRFNSLSGFMLGL